MNVLTGMIFILIIFEANFGLTLIFSSSLNTGLLIYLSKTLILGSQSFIIAPTKFSFGMFVYYLMSAHEMSSMPSLNRQRIEAWNTLVVNWYFLSVYITPISTDPFE